MRESHLAVVDTGPLFATLNVRDSEHRRSIRALRRLGNRLVFPELVIAETLYLAGERLHPDILLRYVRSLPQANVRSPHPEDWLRIGELISTYRDFPLDSVDASVVALAERLNTDVIITLDRRHFSVVRPRHVTAFRLLPE